MRLHHLAIDSDDWETVRWAVSAGGGGGQGSCPCCLLGHGLAEGDLGGAARPDAGVEAAKAALQASCFGGGCGRRLAVVPTHLSAREQRLQDPGAPQYFRAHLQLAAAAGAAWFLNACTGKVPRNRI